MAVADGSRRALRYRMLWAIALIGLAIAPRASAKAPSTSPATRPVDPDLLAHWRADKVRGATAPDISGHAHPIAPAAGNFIDVERAGNRPAFRFRRVTGLTAISHRELEFTRDFTLAMFFRLADADGSFSLIQKVETGVDDGYAILVSPNEEGLAFHGQASVKLVTAMHPAANTWYHLCLTYCASRYMLYIDGKAIATLTSAEIPGANKADLLLGGRGAWLLNGWLDDVRIYRRALRAEDVALLAAGKAVPNPYDLTPEDAKVATALVQQLGDDAFLRREEAHQKLKAMGRRVYPVLRKLRPSADPEVRLRISELLGELPAPAPLEPTVPRLFEPMDFVPPPDFRDDQLLPDGAQWVEPIPDQPIEIVPPDLDKTPLGPPFGPDKESP